jgi:hypothetical protein
MSHGLIVVPRSLRMFQRERHSNKPVDVGSKDRRVENVLATTRHLVLPRGEVCIRSSLGVSCISLRVRRAVSLGRSFVSQTSKRKRRSKTVPVLSAAGLSLSLASGAAIATPTPSLDTITCNARESHENILREEEICDVSLVTFCVFDKEGGWSLLLPVRVFGRAKQYRV